MEPLPPTLPSSSFSFSPIISRSSVSDSSTVISPISSPLISRSSPPPPPSSSPAASSFEENILFQTALPASPIFLRASSFSPSLSRPHGPSDLATSSSSSSSSPLEEEKEEEEEEEEEEEVFSSTSPSSSPTSPPISSATVKPPISSSSSLSSSKLFLVFLLSVTFVSLVVFFFSSSFSISSTTSPSFPPSHLLRNPHDCVVLYQIPSATGLLRSTLLGVMSKHRVPSFQVVDSPYSSTTLSPSPNSVTSPSSSEEDYTKKKKENGRRFMFENTPMEDWSSSSQDALLNAKFIHGNFTFGFHEKLSVFKQQKIIETQRGVQEERDKTQNPFTISLITMLRDPVDRVITDLVHSKLPLNTWNECLSSSTGSCGKLNNDMVRRLSGQISSSWYYPSSSVPAPSPKPSLSDRSMLEQAKRNLDRFQVVGISERLQDTTRLLALVLGWPEMVSNLRDVSSNTRSVRTISDDLRHLIEQNNQLDIELYNYALQLFERQLSNSSYSTSSSISSSSSFGSETRTGSEETIRFPSLASIFPVSQRANFSVSYPGKIKFPFSSYSQILSRWLLPDEGSNFVPSQPLAVVTKSSLSGATTGFNLLTSGIGLGLLLGGIVGGGWIQRTRKKKLENKMLKRVKGEMEGKFPSNSSPLNLRRSFKINEQS